MATRVSGRRIGRLAVLCAVSLTVMGAPPTSAAEPTPCRVRNVTQDTSGRSLIRMVDRAKDGDSLRVRGTCRGHIVIDVDLVIQGRGTRPTVTGLDDVDAPDERVLEVRHGSRAVLRDLTIEQGTLGAISNLGRLRLVRTVVQDSRIWEYNGEGGGIFNGGRLVLVGAIVRRNDVGAGDRNCSGDGGGIYHASGRMTIRRSRIVGNDAECSGGGIYSSATLSVIDSVVSRNSASGGRFGEGDGGGISSSATLSVIDSVVSANEAAAVGGGVVASGEPSHEILLSGSSVTANAARMGGGIYVPPSNEATVTIDASTTITGNTPDDCVGTPACTPLAERSDADAAVPQRGRVSSTASAVRGAGGRDPYGERRATASRAVLGRSRARMGKLPDALTLLGSQA